MNTKNALLATVGSALIATAMCLPSVASANTSRRHVPPYAVPQYALHERTVHGRITGFNGAYVMFVRDRKGYVDHVSLHPGTVINPTGIQLQQGMKVTIFGYPRGRTFVANVINTRYHIVAYPVYGYGWYGPDWGPNWGWGWDPD